jgi:hypothetical protein
MRKHLKKRGSRGCTLGMPSLWGREGRVTLQIADTRKRITGKNGFPMKITLFRSDDGG